MAEDENRASQEDENVAEDEGETPDDEREDAPAEDLLAEVNHLGLRLGEAIGRAWESDERRQVEGQLADGLQRAGQGLHRLGEDLAGSKAVEGVKKGADTAGRALRDGLLSGLRLLNRELDRALASERAEEQADGGDEGDREGGDGDGE